MKRAVIFFLFLALVMGMVCGEANSDSKSSAIEYTFVYGTATSFENPAKLLENPSEWKIQYPNGIGMTTAASDSYANTFYSLYTDKNGTEWIHFAVLGGEKGTSANSSHPRSELRHVATGGDWEFSGKRSLEYTMNVSNTNPEAHFWVGQIHGESTKPPLMIRVWRNALYLELKDPETMSDREKIFLGNYTYGTDVKIKIELNDRNLKVFVDDKCKAERIISNSAKNYWKLGLYVTSTQEKYPEVFYEVFIKDVKVSVE